MLVSAAAVFAADPDPSPRFRRVTLPPDVAGRLQVHVRVLSREIGERNAFNYSALLKSRDYIAKQLFDLGYTVETHEYRARLPHEPAARSYYNLSADRPGIHLNVGREIVLVGAHYDTAPMTPGADDNASGVAVLLELARLFRAVSPSRTVRFVFFSTEEPPFFRTDGMGSAHYARMAKERGDRLTAMVCLEMVGCYLEEKGSQSYPSLMRYFYPSEGNFAAVVGNLSSWGLARRVRREIRAACRVPVEAACLPRFVPGIDFSDHLNFWKEGYPAVMVTDTAFYRYPHYHQPTDTYEKLDYVLMAELTKGLASAITDLARE